MTDPTTPILIGGGQFTQRTAREGRIADGVSPIAMMENAVRAALADAGTPKGLISAIDTVSVVRFTADSSDVGRAPRSQFRNPAGSLARRLGATPRRTIYTAVGGNTPQWLVNRTAEDIAEGRCEVALLAGAEYLASLLGAMKQGVTLDWGKAPTPIRQRSGTDRRHAAGHERIRTGLWTAFSGQHLSLVRKRHPGCEGP